MLGQPNFDDEAPMELLFIDANGTLVDHDRKLVPAPMREDPSHIALPLDRAWTTMQSDAYGSGPRSQT